MMTKTKEDFCRELLDDESPRETLDPERMADRFVRYFKLSARPTLDQLSAMLSRAGFGEVSDREMDGLKGAHIGQPRGHYDIYYRQGLWDGSSTYTVLHETYEIINETLWDIHSRRHPGPHGVPGSRPLRGSGPDAAGGVLPVRRGVGLRRAGLAKAVPLLLRLGDHPAGRGAPGPTPHGRPVRAGGAGRPRRLDGASRAPGDGGAADAGLRDAGLLPRLRRAGRSSPQGQAPPHPAPWQSRPSATAPRDTRTTTATPPSPGPSSGRGSSPRWSSSPCPTPTAPSSAPSSSPPTSWPAGGDLWRRWRRLAPGRS